MLVVEFGETVAVIDGLADNEHGGEGEVVVVNNLGEVLELAPIDFLIRPREVVAGGDRCVLGVFLKEFALHIIDN